MKICDCGPQPFQGDGSRFAYSSGLRDDGSKVKQIFVNARKTCPQSVVYQQSSNDRRILESQCAQETKIILPVVKPGVVQSNGICNQKYNVSLTEEECNYRVIIELEATNLARFTWATMSIFSSNRIDRHVLVQQGVQTYHVHSLRPTVNVTWQEDGGVANSCNL